MRAALASEPVSRFIKNDPITVVPISGPRSSQTIIGQVLGCAFLDNQLVLRWINS
jgi:hypothetical protein